MEPSLGLSERPAARSGKRPGRSGEGLRSRLPNLVVIGAQKCGTSGLHTYLSLHPEVSMSSPKEVNFFILERNWPRGAQWYAGHFDPAARVRGESSPNYTAYPQHVGVPKRMARLIPEAKLVFIVRDPIERIAAHWVHNYAKRREKGDLRETVMHPDTSYLSRSLYHMQLQRFLEHYPLEQILVLDQKDLREQRSQTLRTVFEFVGVNPEFHDPRFDVEVHKTERKHRSSRTALRLQRASDRLSGNLLPKNAWLALDRELFMRPIERPDVRGALDEETIERLRSDAVSLRELTGRRFSHWSIWSE